MSAPSLQSLLDRADELIKGSSAGSTKVASQEAKPVDRVNAIADLLATATEPVEVSATVEGAGWTEIEKTAMALNALNVASEVDMIKRLEKFATSARAEGYSEEMIAEAMTKVSAGKVAESLGTLVSLGVITAGGKDKNSGLLAVRKMPMGISRQISLPNTKGVGY